jgi:hypothetical protein
LNDLFPDGFRIRNFVYIGRRWSIHVVLHQSPLVDFRPLQSQSTRVRTCGIDCNVSILFCETFMFLRHDGQVTYTTILPEYRHEYSHSGFGHFINIPLCFSVIFLLFLLTIKRT